MQNLMVHENPTSNVLAWSAHAANVESFAEEEPAADADEPPDERPLGLSPASKRFQKSTFRRTAECQPSLLTKALQSHSDDDSFDGYSGLRSSRRRRSLTSNVSLASADLTCDTGLTTPARTSSPSPRLPQGAFVPAVSAQAGLKSSLAPTKFAAPEAGREEKKRSISFACVAKPPNRCADMPPPPKPVANDNPKRPCIKFACAGQPPASTRQIPTAEAQGRPAPARDNHRLAPVGSRKCRSPSAHTRTARSVTPKRASDAKPAVRFRNFLIAEPKDLQSESSQFHEFARDEILEDDWIRQDQAHSGRRLTIDDTLKMELAIRRLGKEVEEEVEQENTEDDQDGEADPADDDDPDSRDEDEDEVDDLELDADDQSGYGSDDGDVDDGSSAGYHTDEEVGFAESDDDDDDDLVLWTTARSGSTAIAMGSLQRRASLGEFSDSSAFSPGHVPHGRSRIHRLSPRSPAAGRVETPELPDSTDFVCGTLDEDRPLEEAYMSCIAAKKKEKEKHLMIPQDIDPSFPTSDPEDDDEVEPFKPLNRNSEEHVWLHGEIEDIDQEGERFDRRKKKADSPQRYHSPPPRRHHSPPQRTRGRSPPPAAPRRLFDRQSPVRRLRSPAPIRVISSPRASPVQDPAAGAGEADVTFKALAFRPGLTHTKSLPRAPAAFGHLKAPSANHPHHHTHQRRSKPNAAPSATSSKGTHVRGAIDIVKGLEQRRQRRREKLKEKVCNRARKGLAHHPRPQPGKGAERMRELGLFMAGKAVPGNYVLSV